ncbi:MAG: shikimate dehydrogenase [Candidatus Omnitrophica bacterium]|nr:shikimate dehydrogenase [Candidatus Omnitrophota bacterium]
MGDKYWKLGIIGWPLGYSLSPLMHTAALKACGLKGEYHECPIESNSLGESVHGLSNIDDLQGGIRRYWKEGRLLHGFNVTMPFKSKAFVWVQQNGEVVNESGFAAQAVHVINTVKMDGSKPLGYNTDLPGFLLGLKGINLAGSSVVLLGAGGAARTIAVALGAGAKVGKITIWSRHPENAESTAKAVARAFTALDCETSLEVGGGLDSLPISRCKLLVNATPMGQQGENDVPDNVLGRLERDQLVYDIVYSPRETKLIRKATGRGCRTITGDEMLAGQGAAAFEIWTGVAAAKTLPAMRQALERHFAQAGRGAVSR